VSKRDERKQSRAAAQSSGLGAQLAKEIALPDKAQTTAKANLEPLGPALAQDRKDQLRLTASREENTAADLLIAYFQRADRSISPEDEVQIASIVRSIVEAAAALAQSRML
jgi:hypothetical protein